MLIMPRVVMLANEYLARQRWCKFRNPPLNANGRSADGAHVVAMGLCTQGNLIHTLDETREQSFMD